MTDTGDARYQMCQVCGAKDCDCTIEDLLLKQQAENAALKEQVAQTEFRNERLVSDYASVQEELSTIRRIHVQNIAIKDAEIARLKTVPMKYRRMEFNAQLQQEANELRQQLAAMKAEWEKAYEIGVLAKHQLGESRAREVKLREALEVAKAKICVAPQ